MTRNFYYSRNDGIHGRELWKSDGTKAGTVLVKDIMPGAAGSTPSVFTAFHDEVLFRVQLLPNSAPELWKTDGTAAGTIRVQTFYDYDNFGITELVVSGGLAYFGSNAGLWRSDGTTEGTYRISTRRAAQLTNAGGKLFFTSTFGPPDTLFVSDGTAEGTVQLTTQVHNSGIGAARHLINVNGTLFFQAIENNSSGSSDVGLYRSDGTPEGTRLVRRFEESVYGITYDAVGNTLFFGVNNLGTTLELWKSDGSESGTGLVRVIGPTGFPAALSEFSAVGDLLYFNGFDGFSGNELWRSDGTEEGTYRVADIRPGELGSVPTGITAVNGAVYFAAKTTEHGMEVWQTDGTESGTVRVSDISPGPEDSDPTDFMPGAGTEVMFFADTRELGCELWKYDPRSNRPAVRLVKDADVMTRSSGPTEFVSANGNVYFVAKDVFNDSRLWVSDRGVKPARIVPGAPEGPYELVALDDAVYFNSFTGSGIWRVDGADDVTLLTSQPGGLKQRCGDEIYFTVGGEQELSSAVWKSDGTPEGTVLLATIPHEPGANLPRAYLRVGGLVHFVATDSGYGNEPWVSDGTPEGTRKLKEIRPGTGSAVIDFVSFQDTYYFAGNDGVHGTELWTTDGTEAGTVRITDLSPGSGSGMAGLVAGEDAIYFNGRDSSGVWTLWKSDGTAKGTVPIPTTDGGVTPSSTMFKTVVRTPTGDLCYFGATTPYSAYELWVADADGARLVKDIFPGREDSSILRGFAANGRFYFGAQDPEYGSEVWTSDGTEAGTIRLTDINAGGHATLLRDAALIDSRIYFSADDGVHGQEPWFIDVLPAPNRGRAIDRGAESTTPFADSRADLFRPLATDDDDLTDVLLIE